jgi:non-ribosomal peptide synthetase component E (peptide arylation enzyme)
MSLSTMPLTSAEEAANYRRSGIWPDQTVFERFAHAAGRNPGKLAIIDGERRFTFGELLQKTNALAQGFMEAGVQPGDVVAVQLPNSAEQPLLHLALNRIGALAMPVHDSWRDAELPHLLALSGAVAAVFPANYREFDFPALYARLRADLPKLKALYTVGGEAPNTRSLDELLAAVPDAAALAARRPDPDAPADLMLSSGTTSLPKVSVFSSNDLIALLSPFWERLGLGENDIGATIAPAGTGAIGYVYPLLSPLLTGATAVILRRWSEPEEAIEMLRTHRCTYATTVPAQLIQMLPLLQAAGADSLPALRCVISAGAPLPPDTGRQIEEAAGCRIMGIYGATDGGVASTTFLDDPQELRLSTVGRAQDECEIRLVDALDRPVQPGEAGEIQWRTAGKSYGYLNDPVATAAAFTSDRYYRTGDLGSLDANGYLRITGRVKDMIIRGGRNISPLFIEQQVCQHPAVADVAVAAFPDRVLGERACAFVELRQGCALSLQELLVFLKARSMPTWQMPERLELMEALPRSAGGKVMKNKLREYVAAKVHAEQGAAAATVRPEPARVVG